MKGHLYQLPMTPSTRHADKRGKKFEPCGYVGGIYRGVRFPAILVIFSYCELMFSRVLIFDYVLRKFYYIRFFVWENLYDFWSWFSWDVGGIYHGVRFPTLSVIFSYCELIYMVSRFLVLDDILC